MVKSVFDLDMTPGRMLPLIINVSQYDDIGRTIVFNLYSSVGAWTAPTSASVTFEGGKPDGKFFAYNCAYSSGTVTVTIQQQMTAVAGKVRCKIKVTSGSKVVESAPIIMVVDAAAVPDGSDMSKTDINDAVANATQKIVDQVKDNIPSDYAQLSTDVSSLKSDIVSNMENLGFVVTPDFVSSEITANDGTWKRIVNESGKAYEAKANHMYICYADTSGGMINIITNDVWSIKTLIFNGKAIFTAPKDGEFCIDGGGASGAGAFVDGHIYIIDCTSFSDNVIEMLNNKDYKIIGNWLGGKELSSAKEELSSAKEELSSAKEELSKIQKVVYVNDIVDIVSRNKLTITSGTFENNHFTFDNIFAGIGNFDAEKSYKMVLIPDNQGYITLKILNGISGTFEKTILPQTYIKANEKCIIDIPQNIIENWNDRRIVFLESNTYVKAGYLYVYDITSIPEYIIPNVDFSGGTSIPIEVLSLSNKNAANIVNYDNWYKNKILTTLGDSITAQGRWQAYVKNKLLFTNVINIGVGGTRISGTNENAMWQDKRINAIPLDTDVLTIMGGTNDSAASAIVGEYSLENHDVNTFVGAYNVLISKVLYKFYSLANGKYSDIDYSNIAKNNEYKDIQIFLLTAPFNANTQYSGTNSVRLEEIVNATKKVGEMWKIPCIDIFHNAGINSENASQCLGDGIHINDLGGSKITAVIVGDMKKYQPIS